MSNFQSRWDVNEEITKYVDAKHILLSLSTKGQIEYEDLEKAFKILDDRMKVLKAYESHLELQPSQPKSVEPRDIKKRIQLTIGKLEEQWGSKGANDSPM